MIGHFVGVGQVSLLLRHAQSLKDKRRVVQGLLQKLKNQGFSASEVAFQDEPKRSVLGFSCNGSRPAELERVVDDALRLFIGDFEVLDSQRCIFDFSGEEESSLTEDEDLKFGL